MRGARSRYSYAGYAYGEERSDERELYIAQVPAGSAQDDLRDYNRAGYRSQRPWNDEAFSAVPAGGVAAAQAPKAAPVRKKKAGRQTFVEWLAGHARRERRDVVVCVVLCAVIMMMLAAWGQNLVEGVKIQESIRMYERQTLEIERDNQLKEQQLELARSEANIRNRAQNKLGMLRPGLGQTETIYIRTPELSAKQAVQNDEEPGMQLLDILLGLLSVLHIGE